MHIAKRLRIGAMADDGTRAGVRCVKRWSRKKGNERLLNWWHISMRRGAIVGTSIGMEALRRS